VRVLLPRYASFVDVARYATEIVGELNIWFDGAPVTANLWQIGLAQSAVPTYLLDAPHYFGRETFYGHSDDILRFGFLSRAALELPRVLEWQPDIIHCHDWHTGLLPAYLHQAARTGASAVAVPRTVFTIHNLAYQGLADKEFLPRLGLDWSLFTMQGLEYYDYINPLKAGLVYADAITTVSPQYAREIQTVHYGEGLDGVIGQRADTLCGIVNGIDYDKWSARTDRRIAANFSAADVAGKTVCRRDLLSRLGFPSNSDKPIVGMVSRLSSQKGLDIVAQGMEAMLAMGCHFVLLGTGDAHYTQLLAEVGQRFPRDTSINLGVFNDDLAHRIYAGSDFFLMPSRYEPCGLGQMIALSYGTIPIVRATGGLVDTVQEFKPQSGQGNGFAFEEFSACDMLRAVQRVFTYYRSPQWPRLVQNALECDFSWDVSAAQYDELYRRVLDVAPGTRSR
jgi:starch synthase